jgi:hypothetical protein
MLRGSLELAHFILQCRYLLPRSFTFAQLIELPSQPINLRDALALLLLVVCQFTLQHAALVTTTIFSALSSARKLMHTLSQLRDELCCIITMHDTMLLQPVVRRNALEWVAQ